MTDVVLFHSVLGLRPVEIRAAGRLRAAGHTVSTPDLYAGQVATTLEEGFELKDRIGWATIVRRAQDAMDSLPDSTVLAGFSMGAGVVDSLLPRRPDTAGVLLLHGLATIPGAARAGLPAQLHVADPDPFARPADVAAWRAAAGGARATAQVFTYPGAGHFYLDADLPDHDGQAAALTWQRILTFLDTLTQ
ncbi:MAG: hypothetical protein JWQ81_4713 [Amycolatopsis sp.]|uniref:dienelactone hydrolase family protein n=1 Tax=Amycolatopsis sp. TaxID=37632 RepID=UPI002638FBEC|nr:dienelactone hydrolase family protein [Amycolatopsis sp.]MCU1683974.1 hypothetical protein [Amycolatopsis sp.]